MIIQKALKGISGINPTEAQAIMNQGIICNWWRNINPLPENQIQQRLTEANLILHLNHYKAPDPLFPGKQFGENTPYISVTAGNVERHHNKKSKTGYNDLRPAWQTALEFATNFWRQDGAIFFCYVFVLGQKSIEHRMFSEEARELNTYNKYSPFQHQGEITAKINIPSVQIEKVEFYNAAQARAAFKAGNRPSPSNTFQNNQYQIPEGISNIREPLMF